MWFKEADRGRSSSAVKGLATSGRLRVLGCCLSDCCQEMNA